MCKTTLRDEAISSLSTQKKASSGIQQITSMLIMLSSIIETFNCKRLKVGASEKTINTSKRAEFVISPVPIVTCNFRQTCFSYWMLEEFIYVVIHLHWVSKKWLSCFLGKLLFSIFYLFVALLNHYCLKSLYCFLQCCFSLPFSLCDLILFVCLLAWVLKSLFLRFQAQDGIQPVI